VSRVVGLRASIFFDGNMSSSPVFVCLSVPVPMPVPVPVSLSVPVSVTVPVSVSVSVTERAYMAEDMSEGRGHLKCHGGIGGM